MRALHRADERVGGRLIGLWGNRQFHVNNHSHSERSEESR
jgi:hypothetical protein